MEAARGDETSGGFNIAERGEMQPNNFWQTAVKFAWRGTATLAFGGGVVVLLLWLAGAFAPKVPTATTPTSEIAKLVGPVVAVQTLRTPLVEPTAGMIRAVHETAVGSKLMARVLEVDLKAGQQVHAGDVLIRLDDADLQAKRQQALAAVSAAEAAHAQAQADEQRFAGLLKSNAVSRQDYEKTATAVKSTEAELRRAREILNEVQITLEWATIRSPLDGKVIDKKVDVGDLVAPGQRLVTLYDPERMQLVASVRESLAQLLKVGQEIGVDIGRIGKHCMGTISEIVPEAQAASRAFQVKVTGPCPAGVYTGMFARMLIPLDEEEVLVVPRSAVRSVGQLQLVDVVRDGQASRRAVRTGRTFDGTVEVLSGLQVGELVVAPSAARTEVGHD